MQIVKTIDEVRKTVKAWKKRRAYGWSCPSQWVISHEGHKSLYRARGKGK